MEVVGAIHVVTARAPRIQINTAQINHPEEGRDMVDDREVDHVAGMVFDRTDGDRRRSRGRRAFHEEKPASDAVWITLHHHGAVSQVGQQPRREVEIILKKITFCETEAGPEYFS